MKGERPVVQTKNKDTLPNLKTKSSGESEGVGKGEFTKPVVVGRLDTCLSMGAGRARMEHEKNGVLKGGG